MASSRISSFLLLAFVALILATAGPANAQLSVNFYATSCPSVFNTVRSIVRSTVSNEPRMGASLIRLFFHDCFINGCDAGILLDSGGEKQAVPNAGSVRGYEVIDAIKSQLNTSCGGNVVSCADIVVIAARDSVEAVSLSRSFVSPSLVQSSPLISLCVVLQLGGPVYSVPVGRRDATTANQNAANTQLPGFNENLDAITDKFTAKGFTQREMVALSGAHTVGQAQCFTFRDRIYGETNINATFQATRQQSCPRTAGQGDRNLAPLDDSTPNTFDNAYFQGLINRRGLLHSDQVLFNGGATDSIVTTYSNDANTFSNDFANAMIKMGNLSPLTGTQGQVRLNCRIVN
ncbi:Peroxidase 4 [Nymphaea thermarum]|nr:Peroxidase 4 [Nymphaea thermarum]